MSRPLDADHVTPVTADAAISRSLLLALRGRWDPVALDSFRELARSGGFDWDAWNEAAQAEALSPLLHHILRGKEIVPAEEEERLEAAYRGNAVRNMLAFRELGSALRRLAEEGVPAILLKGAALAETVYRSIAVRQMTDVDLLVRREQAQSAVAALASLGYGPTEVETQPGATFRFENELLLVKPGALDTAIEVHWGLLDSPHHQLGVAMAWFWESALPVRVSGADALVLGPEAQLLHLCAHVALHHRGQGLLWLHDVAEVLHFYQDRLDWDLVLAKAAEFDLVLPVQHVLPAVAESWQAPVPAGVLERISALAASPAEVRIHNWITAEFRPVAQRFRADLAGMPGWRERLRYGMGKLFPSAAYMRQRYGVQHGLLLPVYYPYRWLVGLRSVAQLLSKGKVA